MIVASWILVALLLTLAFGNYLERQHNPNRTIDSRVTENLVREVVLKRNRAGHYVATGQINGKPVDFLLDTGATTVSVPNGFAERLGLRRGPRLQATTANGVITTYSTTLAQVSLGDILLKDVQASINPHTNTDEVLLGMAFLKHLELVQRGDTLTLRQYP